MDSPFFSNNYFINLINFLFVFVSDKILQFHRSCQVGRKHCHNWKGLFVQAQGLFLLHNLPNQPGSHRQVLSGWHVPFLQALVQAERWGERLPISQWSPLNPAGHRHKLLPLHLPPFRQGITHFAERQNHLELLQNFYRKQIFIQNCLKIEKIQKFSKFCRL